MSPIPQTPEALAQAIDMTLMAHPSQALVTLDPPWPSLPWALPVIEGVLVLPPPLPWSAQLFGDAVAAGFLRTVPMPAPRYDTLAELVSRTRADGAKSIRFSLVADDD